MRRLTVLGSCGAWPETGRATNGFLLEYDDFRIVLDLGFGTMPRLTEHCPDGDVDAVVITHEHSDHCVDLNALFRLRHFDEHPGRIPLYCPPGVVERVNALEPDVDLSAVFDIHPLPGTHTVGPFRLEGRLLPHYVPNAGVRLTASDAVVAYTGDTAPDPLIAELGREADLFIACANRTGDPRPRHLLTAREAGEFAREAFARTLLLTHFWPGTDRARAVEDAAIAFNGTILAADEGQRIPLAVADSPGEL